MTTPTRLRTREAIVARCATWERPTVAANRDETTVRPARSMVPIYSDQRVTDVYPVITGELHQSALVAAAFGIPHQARVSLFDGQRRLLAGDSLTAGSITSATPQRQVRIAHGRAPYSVRGWVQRLRSEVRAAVGSCISRSPRIAVAFSGGVDSAAIAAEAREFGEVQLIHVTDFRVSGLRRETAHATMVAETLGLPLTVADVASRPDTWGGDHRLPFFHGATRLSVTAAQQADQLGIDTLLVGAGSDESWEVGQRETSQAERLLQRSVPLMSADAMSRVREVVPKAPPPNDLPASSVALSVMCDYEDAHFSRLSLYDSYGVWTAFPLIAPALTTLIERMPIRLRSDTFAGRHISKLGLRLAYKGTIGPRAAVRTGQSALDCLNGYSRDAVHVLHPALEAIVDTDQVARTLTDRRLMSRQRYTLGAIAEMNRWLLQSDR